MIFHYPSLIIFSVVLNTADAHKNSELQNQLNKWNRTLM